MPGRVSIYGSRELRVTRDLLRNADRNLRRIFRREARSKIAPAWERAVAENSNSRTQTATLVRTARVAVSDQNVQLKSAQVGRSLRGGAKPAEIWHAEEFGAADIRTTYTATSTKGRKFQVTRRTRAQLPARNRKGYVLMPAVANIAPRVLALFAQTATRVLYDAHEGKTGG